MLDFFLKKRLIELQELRVASTDPEERRKAELELVEVILPVLVDYVSSLETEKRALRYFMQVVMPSSRDRIWRAKDNAWFARMPLDQLSFVQVAAPVELVRRVKRMIVEAFE